MATRLISAAVGIVIALCVLFVHGTLLFPIAVGIVTLILQLEFFRVNHLFKYRIATISTMLYSLLYPLFAVGTLARYRLLLTFLGVCGIFAEYIYRQTTCYMRSFFAMVTGMFLLPYGMSSMIILNQSHEQHGIIYVVMALGGAWVADTGAYFVGSYLGKHKLCPTISPKKTIEGLIGGVAADVLFFILFTVIYASIQNSRNITTSFSWVHIIVVSLCCGLLGTAGDLTASVLKRQLEIKDYGTIMPGHGGLLDRFDSVLLVGPFLCAYINAFGYFGI